MSLRYIDAHRKVDLSWFTVCNLSGVQVGQRREIGIVDASRVCKKVLGRNVTKLFCAKFLREIVEIGILVIEKKGDPLVRVNIVLSIYVKFKFHVYMSR